MFRSSKEALDFLLSASANEEVELAALLKRHEVEREQFRAAYNSRRAQAAQMLGEAISARPETPPARPEVEPAPSEADD